MPHPAARAASIALLSLLLLTACGQTAPRTVLAPRPPVPDSLLGCQAQPQPPPRGADDGLFAQWIWNLGAAGQDCRSKLSEVKGILAQ